MTAEIGSYTAEEPNAELVAAFNTDGWLKSSVQYPLTDRNNPNALEGIYIKTDFSEFNFFSERDSPGGDAFDRTSEARNITSLIEVCLGDQDGVFGFNTDGWIKNKISIPPLDNGHFNNEALGLYVRTEWPDFAYLPGLVSHGNDIKQITGKNIEELIEEARKDSRVMAFNTNGWMKSNVASEPEFAPQPQTVLFGTYVKVIGDSPRQRIEDAMVVNSALFILKATVVLWGFWMLPDSSVRLDYQKAVSETCTEIKEYVRDGKFSAHQAAQMAFDMRQQYLVWARQHSSTMGQIFAASIKPADLRIDKYLNKYSQKLFNKDYAKVTNAESAKVSVPC